jgi:tRNA (mo5U34)-methyltransferase
MSVATRGPDPEALIEAGARLSPWAYEIEVRDGVRTSEFNARSNPDLGELGVVGFSSPEQRFKALLLRLFPDGLAGRSVLDCACNSGAYLFWAKELGAGRCFGFDVREHWIEQARFLAEQRSGPTDDVSFAVHDLYDVPSLGLEPYDLTLFHGIFYHLPSPVSGLEIAADLTREALVVSTTTQDGYDDGLLVVDQESTKLLRSGVYGLSWFPTGPEVIRRPLAWMGFGEVRVDRWRRRRGQRVARREELRLVAARKPETIRTYDDQVARRAAAEPALAAVQALPKGAVVLVASDGDEALLELGPLRAWHFPQGRNGEWPKRHPADDAGAIALLERLQGEGAQYLLVPPGHQLLSRYSGLAGYLEANAALISDGGGSRLYKLAPASIASC